jgi:hypothetical protein
VFQRLVVKRHQQLIIAIELDMSKAWRQQQQQQQQQPRSKTTEEDTEGVPGQKPLLSLNDWHQPLARAKTDVEDGWSGKQKTSSSSRRQQLRLPGGGLVFEDSTFQYNNVDNARQRSVKFHSDGTFHSFAHDTSDRGKFATAFQKEALRGDVRSAALQHQHQMQGQRHIPRATQAALARQGQTQQQQQQQQQQYLADCRRGFSAATRQY